LYKTQAFHVVGNTKRFRILNDEKNVFTFSKVLNSARKMAIAHIVEIRKTETTDNGLFKKWNNV
jgi:hypothetical protein